MKLRHVVLTLLIAFAISPLLRAQPYLNKPYLTATKEGKINFYDVQQAFYKWEKEPGNVDVKGKKRFKRWEWYYENRVFPTGIMPDENINYIEWMRLQDHLNAHSLKTYGGNANWVSLSPNQVPLPNDPIDITGSGRINCIEFHPTNPNILWIGASQGGVWKTTDNGQSWVCLTDDLPLNRISDIATDPNDPDIIYLATGDIEYFGLNVLAYGHTTHYGMGIFKTVDGGANWTPLGMNIQLADGDLGLLRRIFVNPANSLELVAAGIPGIYKSYDGGVNWTQVFADMIIDLDMNPDNPNTLFATGLYVPNMGGANRILRSWDFGANWDSLTTTIIPEQGQILRTELTIAPSDTSILYALSCGTNEGFYALFKTEDAGESWFAVSARDTSNFSGALQAPNMLGWYDGGYFNTPFIPADEGGQGTYDLTLIVDPSDPDILYSGGINMWGSVDGGETWDIVSYWVAALGPSVHADQHYSTQNPSSGTYYQANDGGISKSNSLILGSMDSVFACVDFITMELTPGCYGLPTTWENISHGLHITEYYRLGLCKNDPNIIIGGTQDNGTFMYRNGIWKHVWGGDGMEAMIHHTNPDIFYVTNQRGGLSRTNDGGLNFVSGMEEPIATTGEQAFWVTPYKMHPNNPEIIYTAFQNVWKSTNSGANWTKISTIGTAGSSGTRTLNVLEIAPSDPDYIYTSRPGAVFVTKDGGLSWINISAGLPVNDLVAMSVCIAESDPENIWVSFNGYMPGEKVYHSTDAGANWANISGILPNVSANTLAYQIGTIDGVAHALYVGTDIGIFYTNDSIQQTTNKWLYYSQGLPNVIVSEIEIQYGAQKLYAATYGRGLWESNLFSPSVIEGIEPVDESDFVLTVYPNPASNMFTITVSGIGLHDIQIKLFSLQGQKLIQQESREVGTFSKDIDIDFLEPSIYLLHIRIGNSDFTQRIIKVEK